MWCSSRVWAKSLKNVLARNRSKSEGNCWKMFPKGIIIGNFVSILNTVDTPNAMMWFYCSVTMLKRVGENNLTTEELKKKFFFYMYCYGKDRGKHETSIDNWTSNLNKTKEIPINRHETYQDSIRWNSLPEKENFIFKNCLNHGSKRLKETNCLTNIIFFVYSKHPQR